MTTRPTQQQLLAQLRRQIAAIEKGQPLAPPDAPPDAPVAHPSPNAASTQHAPAATIVNRFWAQGEPPRGSLVEVLSGDTGGGGESLVLALLQATTQIATRGRWVIVDRERRFFPPALLSWGIALEQVVIVHPANEADELWAIDQALRCPAVAVVWSWRRELKSRDFRRLQLAAEEGDSLGVLFRPARVRGQPSWAETQWLVTPRPAREQRRVRVELTRSRGGLAGLELDLEIDDLRGTIREYPTDETISLPATAELAAPAVRRRANGIGGRA